jgi:hypothetical protein
MRKSENILQIKNSATETQHAASCTTGKPYTEQTPKLVEF